MRKSIISILLTFLVFFPVFSQNDVETENTIYVDYRYEKCPQEPDAPAVVMFDKGETRFRDTENSFNYIHHRKVRIKILSEPGLKWAEVEIPTYNSDYVTEKVYDITAFSYNVENDKATRIDLKSSDCHKEKQNINWTLMKFAIPNARIGSIIEYEYTIESSYLFNIPDWNFQWDIPVLFSSYKISMMPFYQYQYSLQGASKFDVFLAEESNGFERSVFGVKFKEMDYTFAMKNLGSFKNEGFITTKSDYIIKLDFQLSKITYPNGRKVDVITTWPLLIKDLQSDSEFGKFAKNAKNQAKKIINLPELALLEESKRFDSIITYVKKNYIWDENFRLKAKQNLSQFLKVKHGSTAEINLFAIGLLNAAGIPSYPVIISTRNHSKVKPQYPFYDMFNSVLIMSELSSGIILTDATNLFLENNRIPTECINEVGLLVKPGKEEDWLIIQPLSLSKTKTAIFSSIENNMLKSSIVVTATEYDGLQLRQNYGNDTDKILKHISDENHEVYDSTLIIKNMENAKSPYVLRYSVGNKLQKAGDNIYIEPFLREIITENPFKIAERTYPVDLVYPYQRTIVSAITIPEGFTPAHVPTDKKFSNDNMEYSYQINQMGNQIVVSFHYTLKKAMFQPKEYQQLKTFFKEFIDAAGEKIVLTRGHTPLS